MANKKKTTRKNTSKKNTQQKNYLPTYIISSIVITLLLAVFMYIDSSEGGLISTGIKMGLCGLFGICGFFVPVLTAGCTIYLIKTKDINKFWQKVGLSFLALVNVSALVNLSDINNDIGLAFYFGYAD